MLKEIDDIILNARNALNYQRYLTPVNFSEENGAFLSYRAENKKYDPVYRYNRFEHTEESEKALVYEPKSSDGSLSSPVGTILRSSLSSLKDEIGMYSLVGQSGFTALSEKVFGSPDPSLRELALDTLKNSDKNAAAVPEYGAEHLLGILRGRIEEYGFSWNTVISDTMAAKVSVEPDEKTLYINAKARFTKNDLLRLQAHEIDTHILRSENGVRRGYNIFSLGTAGSLIHEEGLAIYNEYKNGILDPSTMKLYAARFLCCLDIDKPFSELFGMLTGLGCDPTQAMYVVSRIKRGISNTAQPGGFIKDYVYFQGFYEVRNAVEKDPDIYEKMYYGSVSLGDLSVIGGEAEELKKNGELILPLPIVR